MYMVFSNIQHIKDGDQVRRMGKDSKPARASADKDSCVLQSHISYSCGQFPRSIQLFRQQMESVALYDEVDSNMDGIGFGCD